MVIGGAYKLELDYDSEMRTGRDVGGFENQKGEIKGEKGEGRARRVEDAFSGMFCGGIICCNVS